MFGIIFVRYAPMPIRPSVQPIWNKPKPSKTSQAVEMTSIGVIQVSDASRALEMQQSKFIFPSRSYLSATEQLSMSSFRSNQKLLEAYGWRQYRQDHILTARCRLVSCIGQLEVRVISTDLKKASCLGFYQLHAHKSTEQMQTILRAANATSQRQALAMPHK